jgi:hypothetical protein
MFQKRHMGGQRKRSVHGLAENRSNHNSNIQQKNDKQAMTAKSKPSAPSQVQHNFGQATFERPSTAAEAREVESSPMMLL